MSSRVAVIGAGTSGVAAVKCLAEAGFTDIVCFERRDVIGGLWYFNEKKATWVDEACVNRSTVINTSKEFTAYSDYPMPDWFPNFCHNEDIEAYLVDYAKHFGVYKYIRFNSEVIHLTKHSSFSNTGQWVIQVKDHKTGQETTEVYDFVIVANGHHGEPHMPKFPGQDNFQGQIMHSKEFKDVRGWEGKRCVVIGIGNSGGDVVVELSRYSKVFLATRRGAWIGTRLVDRGLPWDLTYHNRFAQFMARCLPTSYVIRSIKKIYNTNFDHDMYALTPDHVPGSTHPTVNDELPNRIACGRVVIKPNVKSFTETGVFFEDGTFEDNISLVVFCTGYNVGYEFIDKSVIDVQNNLVTLYKRMFIPDLEKQTLAFLAVLQPLGAMFPIAELQSRVAAQVFKGKITLPSEQAMLRHIRNYQQATQARYVKSQRHTMQIDWLPFMDELAEMIGAKPNLWTMAFTDPKLFKALLFGPGVPYQFRLQGPNPWPGARNAILTTMDRIYKPFQTRKIPVRQGYDTCQGSSGTFITLTLLIGVAAAGLYYAKQNNIDIWAQCEKLNLWKM